MMAAHYRLDNLVAIVDRNGLQITGSTEDVCQLAPLDEKFEAFGFAVQRCNGNDIGELVRTFDAIPFRPGKPSLVLAKTRKGKGVLLPSACEVDVTGVASMYALQLASGKPSALVD
jgi:transketolase